MITLKRLLPLSVFATIAAQSANANGSIKEIILEGQNTAFYNTQGCTVGTYPISSTPQIFPYQEPFSMPLMNPKAMHMPPQEAASMSPVMPPCSPPGPMTGPMMPPGPMPGYTVGTVPQENFFGSLHHAILLFQQAGIPLKNMKIILAHQSFSMTHMPSVINSDA